MPDKSTADVITGRCGDSYADTAAENWDLSSFDERLRSASSSLPPLLQGDYGFGTPSIAERFFFIDRMSNERET